VVDHRPDADPGRERSDAELYELGDMLVRGLSIEEIAHCLRRDHGDVRDKGGRGGNDEKLPDDIDDKKYIPIPDKKELDLGNALVLDFTREFLADDYDEVRQIFNRRGAYRRFKDFLVRRGALEQWYDFSNKAEEAALREWCAANGIDAAGP
jgi:hypothetical protein